MFRGNNKNTRMIWSVFIVDFEHILYLFLVFLLLTWNKQMLAGVLPSIIVSISSVTIIWNACLHPPFFLHPFFYKMFTFFPLSHMIWNTANPWRQRLYNVFVAYDKSATWKLWFFLSIFCKDLYAVITPFFTCSNFSFSEKLSYNNLN